MDMMINGQTRMNEETTINKIPEGCFPLLTISCSFIFYGLSSAFDYVILLLFVVSLFWLKKHKVLDLLVFPLFFFDNVLFLPFGGGTFIRIFELFYLFDYLVQNKKNIAIIHPFGLPIVYFVMTVWYSFSPSNVVSAFMNITVIYLIYNNRIKKKYETDINLILYSITVASLFASIYAFFRGERVYGFRLAGTISDPNYTALLYLYGIFAATGCGILRKKSKMIFMAIESIALFATASLSALICLGTLVCIYIYLLKPQKGILVVILVLAGIFCVLNIPMQENFILHGVQYRIIRSVEALKIGDYNTFSSHRYELVTRYLNRFNNDTSLFRQLFGGNDPSARGFIETGDMYQSYLVSHNSYIDMMFMVGIVGTVIVILSMSFSIKHYINIYKSENNISYLSLAFLKLATLIMASSLSLFPYKLFSISFLL